MTSDSERDELVMALAEKALQAPASDRDRFLQLACQNDPDLYREASEVVSWEERMSGFLTRPLIQLIDLETLEKIFEPGQTVNGRFEILRCVGEGGMGVVYEAFDIKRKQRIAIKLAKPGFGRLLSPELEGALKVRHPNICLVNEIHTAKTEFGGLDFLTMEFLDGETLSTRLEKGKLDQAEAFEIARQICSGVVEAHRSGILHRDLKPGNIIVSCNEDGRPHAVITDFGLSTESTVASEVRGGTPGYMAPELSRGEKASQPSDVFSLGVILYQMVTGQKPFPASAEEGGGIHAPVAPTKLARDLPRRWDAAILPCLRPEPEKRRSAKQILETLESKPFYRRPALMVAMMARLALVAVAILWLVGVLRLPTSPATRLAILPSEGPADLIQRSQGVLDDVAGRLDRMQIGKVTASVVPVAKALKAGVTRPQDAQKTLGATHALQLKLRTDSSSLLVEGAVIDLSTMTHVRDYSGQFAQADLGDLPSGLAGFVSWALHLHATVQPEIVNAAATSSYKKGREYLDGEPADYTHAIGAFDEAVRLDRHSPLPAAGLAEAYTRKYQDLRDEESKQQAHLWLAKAESLNPDSPTVRIASGLLNTIQGDNVGALEDYQRVGEIQPDNVDALLGSGFAYSAQGKQKEAITNYRRAISLAPKNYKPYKYLGAFYFNSGRYDLAEDPFKKEFELAPERADSYVNLVGVYTAEFKYPEAEKVFQVELQQTRSADTLNNIGAMLALQGKQEDAIQYYKQAVAMDPNMPAYWLNLGDSQRRLKDSAHARASYQHGLVAARRHITANPSAAQARALLAYLLARLGLKEEARSELAAALNSPASDAQVLLCAVETYEALGERERALETAAKATPQVRAMMAHHPDLLDLARDPRFKP